MGITPKAKIVIFTKVFFPDISQPTNPTFPSMTMIFR